MTLKKSLSMLLAVVMVVSAAAFAMAESTTTQTTEEAAAADTAETAAAEASDTTETATYSLDEMMTMAMADAYARQAAYAVYAEAFPDSKSIGNVDVDTQIVLLEMLLKANGVALPENTTDVTAPETKNEAYEAIATAETEAATMYKSFFNQESLPEDAQIIFATVFQSVRSTANTFTQKVQSAKLAEEREARLAEWQAQLEEQQAEMEEMMSSGNAKVYTVTSPNGRGQTTIYIYNSDSTEDTAATDEDTAATDEGTAATEDTDEPADSTTEDSVSD